MTDDQLLYAAIGRLYGLAKLLQTLVWQTPNKVTDMIYWYKVLYWAGFIDTAMQIMYYIVYYTYIHASTPLSYLDCELVHKQGL